MPLCECCCDGVTHVVEVGCQVVADLLELRQRLLRFLFDVTLRGRGALDALIHRPLVLYQLLRVRRVHLLPHRPLLLLLLLLLLHRDTP